MLIRNHNNHSLSYFFFLSQICCLWNFSHEPTDRWSCSSNSHKVTLTLTWRNTEFMLKRSKMKMLKNQTTVSICLLKLWRYQVIFLWNILCDLHTTDMLLKPMWCYSNVNFTNYPFQVKLIKGGSADSKKSSPTIHVTAVTHNTAFCRCRWHSYMSVCLKARIVDRPMMDSEKWAYRGDSVMLDSRFSSRDVCR